MKIGILFDYRVHNWELVKKVMWWGPPDCHYLIQTNEPDPEFVDGFQEHVLDPLQLGLRDEEKTLQKYGVPIPATLVPELPLDLLDGLIVIRSHPELFGPEITYMRRRHVEMGIDVYTVERYDHDGERRPQL